MHCHTISVAALEQLLQLTWPAAMLALTLIAVHAVAAERRPPMIVTFTGRALEFLVKRGLRLPYSPVGTTAVRNMYGFVQQPFVGGGEYGPCLIARLRRYVLVRLPGAQPCPQWSVLGILVRCINLRRDSADMAPPLLLLRLLLFSSRTRRLLLIR